MTSKLTQNLHTRKTTCKTWVLLTNICCARETEFFSKKQNEPMSMWGFETCIHEKWIPKSVFFCICDVLAGKDCILVKKKPKKQPAVMHTHKMTLIFLGSCYIYLLRSRERMISIFYFQKRKWKTSPWSVKLGLETCIHEKWLPNSVCLCRCNVLARQSFFPPKTISP